MIFHLEFHWPISLNAIPRELTLTGRTEKVQGPASRDLEPNQFFRHPYSDSHVTAPKFQKNEANSYVNSLFRRTDARREFASAVACYIDEIRVGGQFIQRRQELLGLG